MPGELLLVGSIPVQTAEEAFRRVGAPLGPWLAYMPDGEVGERSYWIDGLAYRDVARVLKTTEGAVKALLFRATHSLKGQLQMLLRR